MADAGLARFSAHARRLISLQRTFEATTPLARYSRIANIRSGKIIIYAINGAVAAKLRQIEPHLASVLGSEGVDHTGIDIRVQPKEHIDQTPAQKIPTQIGSRQKHALTSLADGLSEESAVKKALTRLLNRAK